MKKIPTLFTRVFKDHVIVDVLNEVTPGCEWVINGEGVATRKLDGTCCLIQDGKIFARYDFKVNSGRTLPDGAIPCQVEADAVTGHFPHWVEVKDQPQYKWHKTAFENALKAGRVFEDGTYELIGKHFMGNPEHVINLENESGDILVKHGAVVLEGVPRDFEGIKDYLREHEIEGIVFHRIDTLGKVIDMCKIKRTDFGFEWNGSTEKQRQRLKGNRRRHRK